jgi:hypothetical protein
MHIYTRSIFYQRKQNYPRLSKRYYPRRIDMSSRSSMLDKIQTCSHIIGNGVGAFVFLYCALQWNYYRNIRKHLEEDEK